MSRRNESYVPLLCDYPDSEKINKVSEGAEAMFCRLLAKCDDEGNYYGSPKRLLGKLFALRYENGTMTARKVLRCRDELVTATLITLYEHEGVEYVHINSCKKSLRKDVAVKVCFPEFTEPLVTQNTTVKELNETVTGTGRVRAEHVTPIQSNPIQSNPKEKTRFLDFIFISKEEHSKLIAKFGESRTAGLIEELNTGIGSKGYKYKSHYFTILNWARRKDKENPPEPRRGETPKENRKRVREDYEAYLRAKTTPALKDLRKDKGQISIAHWLIDEILKER